MRDGRTAQLVSAGGVIDAIRPIIARLRVTVVPGADLTLPGHGGEALHGLFLALLSWRSPALASRLHKVADNRAFSLSPLLGCKHLGGRSVAEAGTPVSFEVGLLGTEMVVSGASALHEACTMGLELVLGKGRVTLKEVDAAGSGRLWSYFEDLLNPAAGDGQVTLDFLSPTAFKVKGRNFLFPQPELVFNSLLERWCAFSPVALPPSLPESFAAIDVSRHHLWTELVAFTRYKWIGFKGQATFLLPVYLPTEMVRAINCLADFAFYSGVGWKTTMGMGQTRRIDAGPLPDGTGGYPEKTRGLAAGHQG